MRTSDILRKGPVAGCLFGLFLKANRGGPVKRKIPPCATDFSNQDATVFSHRPRRSDGDTESAQML